MDGFRRLVALLLLAIWLPATMHCGLESSGLIAESHSHTCDTHEEGDDAYCGVDGCAAVENNLTKADAGNPRATPPISLPCACLLWLQLASPDLPDEPAQFLADFDRAPHWVPDWQFVRRAAPLSRAPSLIG